jgi:hypothetical protein
VERLGVKKDGCGLVFDMFKKLAHKELNTPTRNCIPLDFLTYLSNGNREGKTLKG